MIFPVGVILTIILAVVGLIAGLFIPFLFAAGRPSRRGGILPGGTIHWGGGGFGGGGASGGW
jgi:hypothetical protein